MTPRQSGRPTMLPRLRLPAAAAIAAGSIPGVRLRLVGHLQADPDGGERYDRSPRPPGRTRAERMAMPLARDVLRDVAVEHGACIRPVQLRRRNLDTGEVDTVLMPCGHTLASVCPACAERAKTLRAAQCREGWHLEDEPAGDPARPPMTSSGGSPAGRGPAGPRPGRQQPGRTPLTLMNYRGARRRARQRGRPREGRPGQARPAPPVDPPPPGRPGPAQAEDQPPHLGKTYTAPDGKTFRPSLFVTLTCPSYGRVGGTGHPPTRTYDYDRAARDALDFAALFDRFIQNLRRYLGYDVQYFAAIEPQRRLAPHVHIAMRGTVARAEIRRVLAATYHQVWWPGTSTVKYDRDDLPVWDEHTGNYLDPATGEALPTWDQALDETLGTSRTTWPGSGPGSTPRACSPARRTRPGASAT